MRVGDGSNWPYRLLAALEIPALLSAAPPTEPAPDGWVRTSTRPLTRREGEALECASRGMTTRMIADTLGVAFYTAQTHLKTARSALGAKNTTHACCEAIRRELIP